MRPNPDYTFDDADGIRALVGENPWATIVSFVPGKGLVASHYPILLDEDADGIAIVSHVGRPDERLHELGWHEAMVIVYGPQGYVSPSWYDTYTSPAVPTWNFAVAHLHPYTRGLVACLPDMLSDRTRPLPVIGDELPSEPVHASVEVPL